MSQFERRSESLIRKVEHERREPTIGTVTTVREHVVDGDASNFEVSVSIGANRSRATFAAVGNTRSESIDIPSVGDSVLVEYLDDVSRKPVVTKVFNTTSDRALLGKAGMSKERYDSGSSPSGDGDIYITKYTAYPEDADGPELIDPNDLEPETTRIQIAKKEQDTADPNDDTDLPVKIEFFDSPADGESYISVEMNKAAGVDTDTTWGIKFDMKDGSFKLVDSFGYGIESDGKGNFDWEYKSINFNESPSTGSKSL